MTSRASNWFETKYVNGVIHKLQSEGFLLRPALNSTGTIKGVTTTWKIAGTGVATEKPPGITNSPAMNADRQTVTATMKDYEANDWIVVSDLEKMPENEQQVSQQTAARALGRKFDMLAIGSMDVEAGAIATVGTGAAAISILDILTAQGAIADVAVGNYEYWCALPQIFMQQLELFREFSNSDYVGPEYPMLKQVGARRWRGITFVPLPSDHFAVPAANQLDAYLWVKDCVGLAPNYEMVSRIDYVPEKKAWFAANTMGLANKVLLPEGVKRLRFATNAALSRPTP